MDDPAAGLTVLHLRFMLRAHDTVMLGSSPGSAVRGALYESLAAAYCEARGSGLPHWPDESLACPVCWLLALEDPANPRGRDVPRPMTIEPPLVADAIRPGDRFTFGVSLIGPARTLLPQIVRAVEALQDHGLGKRRGRAALESVVAWSPLTGDAVPVTPDTDSEALPATTAAAIAQAAVALPTNEIEVELLTPLRLTERGSLVRSPALGPFVRRTIERVEALATRYGGLKAGPADWKRIALAASAAAGAARLVRDETRWADGWSGSRRSGRATPTGGLVGAVVWAGDLSAVLPWLLWGQCVHAGKNAVKGDGWFRLRGLPAWPECSALTS